MLESDLSAGVLTKLFSRNVKYSYIWLLQVNKDILEKFVNTVKGKDGTGSNLLNISMGPHLSDALLSSAIIQVTSTS